MTMSRFKINIQDGWEGAWKIIFTHELALLWKSLGCAVQEETLQSAMQDLDQKCMHLLMEINVLMFIWYLTPYYIQLIYSN